MIHMKEIIPNDESSFNQNYEMILNFHLSDFKEYEIRDIIQNKNTDIYLINALFRQLKKKDKLNLVLELQKEVFNEI